MARPKLSIIYKVLTGSGLTTLLNALTGIDLTRPVRYFVMAAKAVAAGGVIYEIVASSRSRKQARVEVTRALTGAIGQAGTVFLGAVVVWWNAQLNQWWYEQAGMQTPLN